MQSVQLIREVDIERFREIDYTIASHVHNLLKYIENKPDKTAKYDEAFKHTIIGAKNARKKILELEKKYGYINERKTYSKEWDLWQTRLAIEVCVEDGLLDYSLESDTLTLRN